MISLNAVRCKGCGRPFSASELAGDARSIICPVCGTPFKVKQKRQFNRRRGTVIVDTPNGILVVAGKRKMFLLPGGGAKKGESRQDAAIRELKEETGLMTRTCDYLFSYDSPKDDRKFRNLHKVFLIEADGVPRADGHEIRYVDYWKKGSKFQLGDSAKIIIDEYLSKFKR